MVCKYVAHSLCYLHSTHKLLSKLNCSLQLGKNDIMSQSSLESAMYYPCYDEGLATPDQMTGTYKEADFKRRE